MDENQIINCAILFITDLFAKDCSGHDVEHSLRVYNNAIMLADTEPQCNRFIVSLSALLHDADDYKLFKTENNYNTRFFLEKHLTDKSIVEQICEVINSVSFSKNKGIHPKTLEGKIIQDADRLDAIGAIGIARTFTYGGCHGRSISDSIKHFEDKLLKLKDEINTDEGKKIAEIRHNFMKRYISELKKDMNSYKQF